MPLFASPTLLVPASSRPEERSSPLTSSLPAPPRERTPSSSRLVIYKISISQVIGYLIIIVIFVSYRVPARLVRLRDTSVLPEFLTRTSSLSSAPRDASSSAPEEEERRVDTRHKLSLIPSELLVLYKEFLAYRTCSWLIKLCHLLLLYRLSRIVTCYTCYAVRDKMVI